MLESLRSIFFITLCLTSLCSLSLAQSGKIRIYGTVKDKVMHEPIVACLFTVVDAKAIPQAYTVSDAEGRYELFIQYSDSTSLTLEAQTLGYKLYRFSLSTLGMTSIRHDVELEMTSVDLEQVVVREKRSIKVAGDTVTYRADKFRRGVEQSVEDLLRQIPGVKIDENGDINYKDKLIERVFIEGENVFGRQYATGTRNISADVVEEFEFIDHFIENKLLIGVADSEEMALNIKLKDKFKSILAGNLHAGLGTDKRKDLRLNLFSFGKRLKLFGIARSNNVTLDEVQATSDNLLTSVVGFQQEDQLNLREHELLKANTSFAIPFFQADQLAVFDTDLIKPSLFFRPTENFKIDLSYSRQAEKKRQGFFYSEVLLSEKEEIRFQDRKWSEKVKIGQHGRLNLQWLPSLDNILKYSISVYDDQVQGDEDITNVNRRINDQLVNDFGHRQRLLQQALSFTARVDSNNVFQFVSGLAFKNQQQSLQSFSAAKRFSFDSHDTFDTAWQSFNNNSHKWWNTLNLYMRWRTFKAHFNLGHSLEQQTLFSDLEVGDLLDAAARISSAGNNVLHQESMFWGGVKINGKLDKIKLEGGLRAGANIRTLDQLDYISKRQWVLFEPQLLLHYTPKFNQKIWFSFRRKLNTLPLTRLMESPIMTSYRSFVEGRGELFNSYHYYFKFGLHQTGVARYTNLSLASVLNTPVWSSRYTFNDILSIEEALVAPSSRQLSLNFTGNRLLLGLSGTINLETNIGVNWYENEIELDVVSKNRHFFANNQISYKSGFELPIQFEAGYRLNYLHSNAISNLRVFANENHFSKIFLKFFSTAKGRWKGELVIKRINFDQNILFTGKFALKYSLIKERIHFTLIGNNLLTKPKTTLITFYDFGRSEVDYFLSNSFVLCKIAHSFGAKDVVK